MRLWPSMILPVALSVAAFAKGPTAPSLVTANVDATIISLDRDKTQDKNAPDSPGPSEPQPATIILVASGLICFGMTRKFRVNR
jgi:hypothetical protein